MRVRDGRNRRPRYSGLTRSIHDVVFFGYGGCSGLETGSGTVRRGSVVPLLFSLEVRRVGGVRSRTLALPVSDPKHPPNPKKHDIDAAALSQSLFDLDLRRKR